LSQTTMIVGRKRNMYVHDATLQLCGIRTLTCIVQAFKNATSPLAAAPTRDFASKYGDPSDATNLSPLSLATNGLVPYSKTRYLEYNRPSNREFKDVHYEPLPFFLPDLADHDSSVESTLPDSHQYAVRRRPCTGRGNYRTSSVGHKRCGNGHLRGFIR
jgi:hypothetical protein